jgi:putative Holliday junction resolvase
MEIPRCLGIDYGQVRVGTALSDPLGLTAQAYKVLSGKNREALFAEIKKIVDEYDVKRIVVGMPKNMDGTNSRQTDKVAVFVHDITEAFPEQEVCAWDERLTTMIAEQVLINADLSRYNRRQVIDKVSASIILQSYLDHLRQHQQKIEDSEH